MEDQLKELEVFKKGIENLKEALSCFIDCNDENVSVDEYAVLESLFNDFTDRAMYLENEVNSYKIEEEI